MSTCAFKLEKISRSFSPVALPPEPASRRSAAEAALCSLTGQNYPRCSTTIQNDRNHCLISLPRSPAPPLFSPQVERPYQRLLQAADANAAGDEWSAFRLGLQDMDAYLITHGSTDGPYFTGREPSLAEAATAPALFRMVATLVRGQRGSRGWALAGGKRNGAGNYWGAAPIYLSMIIECACIYSHVCI